MNDIRVNHKVFVVWKYILTHNREWMDAISIAGHVDMTSREVISAVRRIPSDRIRQEKDEMTKYINFYNDMTDDEARETLNALILSNYRITPDMVDDVRISLSHIGWLTVTDISEETSINKLNVVRILETMPDVLKTEEGGLVMYKAV